MSAALILPARPEPTIADREQRAIEGARRVQRCADDLSAAKDTGDEAAIAKARAAYRAAVDDVQELEMELVRARRRAAASDAERERARLEAKARADGVALDRLACNLNATAGSIAAQLADQLGPDLAAVRDFLAERPEIPGAMIYDALCARVAGFVGAHIPRDVFPRQRPAEAGERPGLWLSRNLAAELRRLRNPAAGDVPLQSHDDDDEKEAA